jgi:hypothetical protein
MADEPADEPAGEPLASTPRRRGATRRPKGSAQSPATIALGEIVVGPAAPGRVSRIAAGPVVVEDGASVDGELVELRRSAVGRVEASQLSVDMGAIGAARAEHLTVERGAIGAALGEQVGVSRGYARSILARQVQLDRSAARVVIAADVRTNQTAVMFLVARKVSGDVRVVFDWRGAVAFGAAAGIAFALLRRVRGRRSEGQQPGRRS